MHYVWDFNIVLHHGDLLWRGLGATLALTGAGAGMLVTLLAGLIATRRVLTAPASVTLRALHE